MVRVFDLLRSQSVSDTDHVQLRTKSLGQITEKTFLLACHFEENVSL